MGLKWLKQLRNIAFVGMLLGLSFVSVGLNAQRAQAAPFICTNQFFQVINGTLKVLNPADGTYVVVGSTGSTGSLITNAIGYNSVDNYIYGWQEVDPYGGGSQGLVRIEDDATTTPLGIPAGVPTPANYVAGDFDTSGHLYILRGGTNQLYKVNVSALTSSMITMSSIPPLNEIVYVDGLLYSVAGTTLYTIDPVSGVITTKTLAITPDPGNPGSVYGAGWASNTGQLYFSRNSDGVIVEISNYTGVSPVATPVLAGQTASGNDGASCILAQSAITPLQATSDTGTTKKNTPITGTIAGGLLSNDSGQQIAVTSYTQPAHGSVVINPDGSYAYTPATDYVGSDSFTYTITDEFGSTRTATVTLTITDDPLVGPTLPDTGQPQLFVVIASFVLLGVGLLTYRMHIRHN